MYCTFTEVPATNHLQNLLIDDILCKEDLFNETKILALLENIVLLKLAVI